MTQECQEFVWPRMQHLEINLYYVPPSKGIIACSLEYGQSFKQRQFSNNKSTWKLFNRSSHTKMLMSSLSFSLGPSTLHPWIIDRVELMKANHMKGNDYLCIVFISKMNCIPLTHIIFHNTQMFELKIQHYSKHVMNLICIIRFQKG